MTLAYLYSHYPRYLQDPQQCIRLTDVISCKCIADSWKENPGHRTTVWALLHLLLHAYTSHGTLELKWCAVSCCSIPSARQTVPGSHRLPCQHPRSSCWIMQSQSLLLPSHSVIVRAQRHQAHCDAINMLIACRYRRSSCGKRYKDRPSSSHWLIHHKRVKELKGSISMPCEHSINVAVSTLLLPNIYTSPPTRTRTHTHTHPS